MSRKIHIVGAGCALADFVYNGIDFNGPAFLKYRSRQAGDGGLFPGRLIFTEEFETYTGKNYLASLRELTEGREPDVFNIGGPSIVSLIHAAQLLPADRFSVQYFGTTGRDETSLRLRAMLGKTPLDISHYEQRSDKPTPFTHVLSDPDFDHGNGERTFINNIGASWDYGPEDLPDCFFQADLVCLGGTALVPHLHDHLHEILAQCKLNGARTLVNTVFDFRHEKTAPDRPWPLGDSTRSFPLIDLLIVDLEEGLRISGARHLDEAVAFLQQSGVGAFMVTRGAQPVLAWSRGSSFQERHVTEFPVSAVVTKQLQNGLMQGGDTTGCGDNFVGGVMASVVEQMSQGQDQPDLAEACALGIVSGGFACSYAGGTYFEKRSGEKRQHLNQLYCAYREQIK
jgi:sugar/nucleoside kinase (ribokinase family)